MTAQELEQRLENVRAHELSKILMSYADTKEAKDIINKMNNNLPTPKDYVIALADGLLYGNWPWVNHQNRFKA